ncbi:MAG: MFS transporter [Acutalibacteraceae bacterium]
MVKKVKSLLSDLMLYWKIPPAGRYMTFKEIAAYAGGGIGAYLIVCMSIPCVLGATNVFLSGVIGIGLTDMYIMYVIGVLSGIPLTALRANIVDNTRNKAGKYRPYILRMGIPCAAIFVAMVWFPYDKLSLIVGQAEVLPGKSADYIAKCAIVLLFNIALQFFYYFFYDAYENLIHVLSPNSQERTDVASIKSVIYSFGPTVYNIIIPLIAAMFGTNQTDIKVYRFAFPVIGVIGTLLLFVVYANTQEKIVQAKTHVVQIKFIDALRAVAKNKYFWIISLAGWLGFLETAYANILYWLCNYGGACSNATYTIVNTVYGNASLWGMILAPICIRKWGKKNVQIVTNLFNILFILMMYPFFMNDPVDPSGNLSGYIIWAIMACLWLNALVGSFGHILNPSIQADIRDYQQYITGERIDGMFAAVATIGSVITLITSSVLPALQEKFGMNVATAKAVTSNSALMSRVLPGTNSSIGELLASQYNNGQNNFINPSSALYDVQGVLIPLLKILILVAAAGAIINVIPYFFYDLTEKKQKGIVRILKIRAMFEDYGNGIVNHQGLVEAIDIIRDARELAGKDIVAPTKAEKKADKKAYKQKLIENEEIEISNLVIAELEKFSTPVYKAKVKANQAVYAEGLRGLYDMKMEDIKKELREAKLMPTTTKEEKELRKFAIEIASKKKTARKVITKHYKSFADFTQPDFAVLDALYGREDEIDVELKELYIKESEAKKAKESTVEIKAKISALTKEKKEVQDKSKAEMDRHSLFAIAAKPYLDAEKLIKEQENFNRFDEIAAKYEESKASAEAERQAQLDEQKRLAEEKEAKAAQIRAEREAAKAKKK